MDVDVRARLLSDVCSENTWPDYIWFQINSALLKNDIHYLETCSALFLLSSLDHVRLEAFLRSGMSFSY